MWEDREKNDLCESQKGQEWSVDEESGVLTDSGSETVPDTM